MMLDKSSGEWVQLPSLEPPPLKPHEGTYYANASSHPSVAETFIGEMQSAHQRLRSTLWPHPEEPKSLQDKVQYLHLLKNRILNNIARTMFGLNAEDVGRHRRRLKRGSGGWSGDSEIGFPSLEVALLTLAFLVFAVFLVNMVLVLFSNIFGSSSTTSTSTALGRRKRGINEDRDYETMKVLQALEEYPLRHRNAAAHCYADPAIPCDEKSSPLPQIAQFLFGLKV